MVSTNQAMEAPQSALNELLRLYVPSAQKRVYPPGIRVDANGPRINITPLTPTTRRWLGRKFGTGSGKWLDYVFRIDITDKLDPNQVDKIASEVDFAVESHLEFRQTDTTYGYFVNMKLSGGSGTEWNPGLQAYQKTMNFSGQWLSLTSATW
jgi:hypothetical protein